MKTLSLIISLLLILGLIVGCAQQTTEPTQPADEEQEPADEADIAQELDDTYVADEELDVGEMF
ncbi:hypothetical protein ISS05_04270 [Candidatus Woesearchaeota archaeon]|nr:hypothetical protein [Candidatus Woesearchaeota archaeon]